MNDSAKGSIALMKPASPTESDVIDEIRHQYLSNPYKFAGTENALYECHLMSSDV
jgi:hypothetical protein